MLQGVTALNWLTMLSNMSCVKMVGMFMKSHTLLQKVLNSNWPFVGSMEAPIKTFLLFSLLHDWLKLNHLRR